MAPASQEPESASPTTTRPDNESVDNIAQAYKDLLRGEQAATALETNLTNLESRLDALLAAFEAAEEPQKGNDNAAPTRDHEPNKDAAARNGDTNGQDSAGTAKKP